MMKKANLKKVVGVLGIVALLLSVGIYTIAMAEKPVQKPVLPEQASKKAKEKEPKLIWKKTFDGAIDFSMSNDANFILVNSKKRDGDKVKVARYLLNKTGKTLQKEENEGLYDRERGGYSFPDVKKGGLEGVISGDGEHIITRRGIENREGKLLSKEDFLISQFKVPVYSPSGKYIVVIPGYEGASPYVLQVYSTKSGKLLWQFQRTKVESCEVPFLASFILDEKLAVYTEGKVILFDTKSGRKYWEKFLFEKYEELLGLQNIISSKTGNIVLFHPTPNTTFSLDKNGEILWMRKEKIGLLGFSNKGNIVVAGSRSRPFKLLIIDNKTGNLFWQKRFKNTGYANFTINDKYLFISGFLYEHEGRSEEMKGSDLVNIRNRIYLLDMTGKVLWRLEIEKSLSRGTPKMQISSDCKNLVIEDENNLYLFDIANLWEAE